MYIVCISFVFTLQIYRLKSVLSRKFTEIFLKIFLDYDRGYRKGIDLYEVEC